MSKKYGMPGIRAEVHYVKATAEPDVSQVTKQSM